MRIVLVFFLSSVPLTSLLEATPPRDLTPQDKKNEAIDFLESKTMLLPQKLHCLNYETLTTWIDEQKKMQRWTKVHWTIEGYCKYLGLTSNPKLQVSDPTSWQSDLGILIEERNFYEVSLANNRYSAKYTDESRFTDGAEKQLGNVEPTDSLRKPLILEMMIGEFFTRGPLLDFVENNGSRIVKFSPEFRHGRSVKSLVIEGHVSRENNPQAIYMNRFTWDFDAETGYCLYSTGDNTENETAGGFCKIEYSKPKADIWFPAKTVSKTNSFLDTQTTYIRNCNTNCIQDFNEHMLSYHGFKEPTFESDVSVSASNLGWKLWLNIGIVLLLLALVLRFRQHAKNRS